MTDPLAASLLHATKALRAAESSVRILRTLAWDPSVRRRFLERGATELPAVTYPAFDAGPVHEQLRAARQSVDGGGAIDAWLTRTADAIAAGADLLAAAGTPAFLRYGQRLFGVPTDDIGGGSALTLARTVDAMCAESAHLDLGAPAPACHVAGGVAQRLRAACAELFGGDAPEVVVVDHLSSNALAGPRRIQVRRSACFTDLDVEQLIQHEAYVHVCTALNGRLQHHLPILAASHPGTTRTQEGLAVFAEFISGTLDPDRFRRLADRVLAIQMAIDGGDFLDVYRFFLERRLSPEQAFENARRVFRGGVLTGGAPFMKDAVYLEGFLRVTNFLRAVAAGGRGDCLLLLFCGKLDLEDVPVLAELADRGLCRAPRFLPPWASDRRFLVAYLAYAQFLGSVDVDAHRAHYRDLLKHAPDLRWLRTAAGSEAAATRAPGPA